MIKLPQITLVALTGLGYKVDEHLKALQESSREIEFGEIKLIQLGSIKTIDDWNKAIIYDLHNYISTDYCLLVHADGYVVNPQAWQNDWLNYDYIGAPFPLPQDNFSYRDKNGTIQRVGNSVSLRSKKLLGLASQLQLDWQPFHGFYNEDGFICVNNRHIYEAAGMKFAPLDVAVHFSKEHEIPENKNIQTFAFHQV